MRSRKIIGASVVVAGHTVVAFVGCENKHEAKPDKQGTGSLGASASIASLLKARGLSEADVEGALKTYVPSGKMDEYYIFGSGGQSGNVDVIGEAHVSRKQS